MNVYLPPLVASERRKEERAAMKAPLLYIKKDIIAYEPVISSKGIEKALVFLIDYLTSNSQP